MEQPIVLVTGTSSGIGLESVGHLVKAGCLVVATARDPAKIVHLAAPGQVECLALDVASEASRTSCIRTVLERHGRIDVLVNNAGYGPMLAVEDTSAQALRDQHETNVVGPHELARLVLPGMRQRGSGRIVNVASVAGHIAVPLLGAYCSSKFALRALTQAMDNEVRRFGIRAVLVEPGVIRTNFGTRSLEEAKRDRPGLDGPYEHLYQVWHRRRMMGHGAHPRVIARRIVAASLAQHPRFHNFAPLQAKLGNLAKRWLPDSWIDAGLRAYYR